MHTRFSCMLSHFFVTPWTVSHQAPLPWDSLGKNTRVGCHPQSGDITLPTKIHLVKAMFYSSSHVWMWELDCEESRVQENRCFWTVVLKTLEGPLDCKEIQPVHPKGDQSWVFIGRTDAEAETPILWPPDAKNWLTRKDPDTGKDWKWEEKGTTEDEMVGWHHRLDGHGFGWTLGVGDGQGSLACCSPWGRKELDTTELLNWTELNLQGLFPIQGSHLYLLYLLHCRRVLYYWCHLGSLTYAWNICMSFIIFKLLGWWKRSMFIENIPRFHPKLNS